MSHNAVIVAGGYSHPFEETGECLQLLATTSGHPAVLTKTLDEAVAQLTDAKILTINTLLWSMTQHDKYAADRAEHAYALSDAHMDAMEAFVERGGGLFAVHTSVISFDTQPRWKELLGGGWTWDHSYHPPLGPISVQPTGALGLGTEPFEINDEAYHHLDPVNDAEIVAACDTGDGPQPVAWVRKVGKGRVGVNALGHDAASLETPGLKAMNRAILDWLDTPGGAGLL